MSAREIARYITVALMGVLVLGATVDGFSQSWSGLYQWALEHDLAGWKAMAFPGMVDAFIGVGELGLFLLAIDGHKLRRSLLSWADLLLPAAVAASGWGASLVFNVGRVDHHGFATEATAAVPPIASMVGLVVLLRTLHRYVTQSENNGGRSATVVPADVAPLALAVAPEGLALDDALDDVPAATLAWLKGEDEVRVPVTPDPEQVHAASVFGDEVRRGETPGIRAIKKRLGVGQDKAERVQVYLAYLAENQPKTVAAR